MYACAVEKYIPQTTREQIRVHQGTAKSLHLIDAYFQKIQAAKPTYIQLQLCSKTTLLVTAIVYMKILTLANIGMAIRGMHTIQYDMMV